MVWVLWEQILESDSLYLNPGSLTSYLCYWENYSPDVLITVKWDNIGIYFLKLLCDLIVILYVKYLE